MPCMCGDLYCGSCGPAQGNHRCDACGEWEGDHGEHEAQALAEQAGDVLAFLKSLAAGTTPIDYHVVRSKARDLLAAADPRMLVEDCQHYDEACQIKVQQMAEDEARMEIEMEKAEAEWNARDHEAEYRATKEAREDAWAEAQADVDYHNL